MLFFFLLFFFKVPYSNSRLLTTGLFFSLPFINLLEIVHRLQGSRPLEISVGRNTILFVSLVVQRGERGAGFKCAGKFSFKRNHDNISGNIFKDVLSSMRDLIEGVVFRKTLFGSSEESFSG